MKKLLLLTLLVSCVSIESKVPMENRVYDMCVDVKDQPTCDGFCYQEEVCTKRFLKMCIKKEIQITDKIQMSIGREKCLQLFNINFVLSVRKKI